MYPPKPKSQNPIWAIYRFLHSCAMLFVKEPESGNFFLLMIFSSKRGQKVCFSGVWDFVLRKFYYRYFRKSGLALGIMADNVFVRCPLNLCWQAVQSKTLISPWKHAHTRVVGEKGKLNHNCGRRPSMKNISISNILFRCWFEYWRKAFQSTFPLLGNACTWKVSTQ